VSTASIALGGAVLAVAAASALGLTGPHPSRPVSWFAVDLLERHGLIRAMGWGSLAASFLATGLVVALLLISAGLVHRAVTDDFDRFAGLGRRLLGANPGSPGGGPAHLAGLFGCCGLVALLAFVAWHGPEALVAHLLTGEERTPGSVAVFLLATMVATYTVLWLSTEITHRFDRRRLGGRSRFQVRGWALFALSGLALLSYLLQLDPPYVFALVAGYAYQPSGGDGSDPGRDGAPGAGAAPSGSSRTGDGYAPGSARAVVAGAAATMVAVLAAALLVELLGLPREGAASGLLGLWVRAAEESVAAVVTLGAHTVVFGMLPLPFLPGYQVFTRSRAAWAAGYGLLAWMVVVAPTWAAGSGPLPEEALTAMAPLVAIATVAAGFGVRFRLASHRPAPAAP
jgi:hypothetical protein